MLKGLKKKPAPEAREEKEEKEYSRVRNQVGEHSIRQAEMMEAEEEEERDAGRIVEKRDERGEYVACMEAFLNGRTQELDTLL